MNESPSISVYKINYECPYFPDQRETVLEYFYPDLTLMDYYGYFLSRGFRRYQEFFYRNICTTCDACIPIRLRVSDFQASKSQRRTYKHNTDIVTRWIKSDYPDARKIELFKKYRQNKHDNHSISYEGELVNLHCGFSHIWEIEYYLGEQLIGVSIIDEAQDALSANYFYYDTDFLDRRLGIFSMLKEIEYAKSLNKEFYYMGFYIEENQKMRYKKFFRPNEILHNGVWERFLG